MIAELMAGEKYEFTKHFIINRTISYSGPKFLRYFFSILQMIYGESDKKLWTFMVIR